MKACPYCAEEIQDAAIVCKHCGRDIKPTAVDAAVQTPQTMTQIAAPAATTKGGKGKWFALFFIAVVGWFVYVWATSSMSVDLPAAQRVVDMMEKDGVLTRVSCSPNEGTLSDAAWLQLTHEQRDHLLGAMSRVCYGSTHDMHVTLYRASNRRPLATYDGFNMTIE